MAVMAGAPITSQVVVVTGASQGIGLEFARQLLAKSNTVIAAVRDPSAAGLAALAKESGSSLHVTVCDVSSPASISAWAKGLAESSSIFKSRPHIDCVINCAGVYGRKVDLASVTAEDMQAVFQVNAVGPLLVVQQLLAQNLLGGFGGKSLVANITSKVGSVDDNRGGGGYAYRASKSALNIINKSMSIDLAGDGITAVLLHPGYVRTRMTGGQGLIDVEESVAGMLAVLEGDAPLNGNWYAFDGKVVPW